MKIEFNSGKKIFRIYNGSVEYAFFIAEGGNLINLYWGAPVSSFDDYDVFLEDKDFSGKIITRNAKHPEYSTNGAFDYTKPCLRAKFSDGTENVRLVYKNHKIEGNTLYVTICDTVKPLEVTLKYKIWNELPLISRSCEIKNAGTESIILKSVKSASLYMSDNRNYRLTHFSGDANMEYQKNQTPITQSKIYLETSRLTEAAVQRVPFFALDEGYATETFGEVFFGALEWSGDFQIVVEKNFHSQTGSSVSVSVGVSDFTSNYKLEAGESFETPALTIGYSDRGFEKMSEILYDWEYDCILPKGTTDKAHTIRPVIYNTWYPYEFGIDEKKLMDFIPKVKYIGAELYVIDDGWMQGRDCSVKGLGDWLLDKDRFPSGLKPISDAVHKEGMLFGLWVEPEMANEDSDLFKNHRDWFILDPNHENTKMRSQYILDMSRDEIRDWTIEWLDNLIIDAGLDYLKWDMNRIVSEVCPDFTDNAVAIKYIKNIYYIWEHLNKKFPDLLLENCASGGGRADFGMLKYADRVNRSDNADPIDVLDIHEGYTTLFVPKIAGGAGNVAPERMAVSGREVPIKFRTELGMTGSMSVGINLLKSSDEELLEIKTAVEKFKEIRKALQDSYVYRIASKSEHPYTVFEYKKRDKSEFTLFTFGHGLTQANRYTPLFKIRGLDPDTTYACGDRKMSGKALMNIGIKVEIKGDYASDVQTWKKLN